MSSKVRKATKEEALRITQVYEALHATAVEMCLNEPISAGELLTALLDLITHYCDVAGISREDLIKIIQATEEVSFSAESSKVPYTLN